MTKSMTGYGKAEGVVSGKKFTVEMKSVNHRFLEISLRMPQILFSLEAEIKRRMGERFSRGKIDVSIRADGNGDVEGETCLALNMPLVRNYYALLNQLKEELNITEEISLSTITGLRDVFMPVEAAEEAADLWGGFSPILDEAINNLSAMREKEGESLMLDLRNRLEIISGFLEGIAVRVPEVVLDYQKRLSERIRELTAGVELDESRLLQEVAIMAEKSDITEEIVRFRSHIEQFSELLTGGDAAGRKIDFLLQEMGREVNTIGSKSGDVGIARLVVEIKSELAKLREQAQNIE
ncbi:MAG: YicC family protein [Syntrophales bacterium]|nr:YicC family protein [Syntrophales bacterium]